MTAGSFNIRRTTRDTLIALGLVLSTFYACLAEERPDRASGRWPGFLGAGASELNPETLPLSWSPEQNMAWTVPIPGYGQSSPVIFNGRVLLTSVEGDNKQTLQVVCLDLKDGRTVWKHSSESSYPEKNSV